MSFDKLRANGKWMIPFMEGLSSHERIRLVQHFSSGNCMIVLQLTLWRELRVDLKGRAGDYWCHSTNGSPWPSTAKREPRLARRTRVEVDLGFDCAGYAMVAGSRAARGDRRGKWERSTRARSSEAD